MANPLTVANRTWTYADLLKLPEEQRCEIIDGEYFDMTPAPNRLHQEILGNLFRQIINQLDGKPCKVYFAPFDVRLPDSDDQPDGEIRNVVQPDLVVICDEKKLDDRGCRGAPDLAVEILSPSTAGKDQVKKRRLYERCGVKEFWVLHPADRLLMVSRLVSTKTASSKAFGPMEIHDATETVSVKTLPGLTIDLTRIFPPEPQHQLREPSRPFSASRKPQRRTKSKSPPARRIPATT